MKIKHITLMVFIWSFCSLELPLGNAQTSHKELTYPPLRDIQMPHVERVVLENGMILFLTEDHELPLIQLSAVIGTGSVYEPPDKVGLAGITGTVMRTGGSTNMSGEKMDEILESIASSVETGIGKKAGSASMSTLKEHLDQTLSILADVMMHPAFPQEKIDLAKVEERSMIARRNDDPGEIINREFQKLIYGESSPYSRHTEYETIDAISREDLVAFHQKFFHPNNVIIGIWGDFETETMVEKIQAAFSGWGKSDFERPPLPEIKYEFDSSVNLIEKKDINQAYIELGHIGGKRSDPDYFALIVMNQILGAGGFSSRIVKNVRTEKGLAYSTWGVYSFDWNVPGVFSAGCQTKAESAVEAIEAITLEIEKITEDLVTDDELNLAKEQYLNSFVFNFDTKGEIVNRLLTYEYYGFPKDFLQRTKENIEIVTKEDVLRVAQKHLRPNKLRILVLGNPEEMVPPLTSLGEVNTIDITIPVPEEEKPEATEKTRSEGKQLLAKAIEAAGGRQYFEKIQSIKIEAELTIVTPQGELAASTERIMMMPNKVSQSITLPMGTMTQIYNEGKAWLVTPNGANPAPDVLKEEIQSDLWRNIQYLYAQMDQEGLDIQALDPETVEEHECKVLLIDPANAKSLKLFLDAETFLPLKMSYKSVGMQGAPVDTEELLSDYREINGIKLPFHTLIFQDGKKAMEYEMKSVELNPEVDESIFQVDNQ